jgi:hypothetical protein
MYQLPSVPREADIRRLVVDQVAESVVLDYKAAAYDRDDEGTREMLRDIASFANAGGGHIVLGMAEAHDVPTSIVGLSNALVERDRIMASVRSATDPRLLGLDVHLVDIAGSGAVIVLSVPRSPEGPHMVTFKGLNQFWKRVGTTKQPMNTLEIREACMRGELLRTRMVDFLDRQWELGVKHIQNTRGQYLSITPTLLEDDRVNAFDNALHESIYEMLGKRGTPWELRFGNLHPSLDGIENQRDSTHALFRLFRDGHLDYTYPLSHQLELLRMNVSTPRGAEEGTVLHHNIWSRHPLVLLRLAKSIYERFTLVSPVIVEYGLIYANNMRLPIRPQHPQAPTNHFEERDTRLYDGPEQHVRIQMQFDHTWEPTTVAKALVDRFWNAFHWPECPFPIDPTATAS